MGHLPTSQIKKKETPLHKAAYYQNIDICMMLINYGASVNEFNENLETPLHVATRRGENNICQLLINFGSDPYCKTRKNETILHIAAKNEHVELCKKLLENHFFDTNIPDCNGNTPKGYILQSGNEDLISLIYNSFSFMCLHVAIVAKNLTLCQSQAQNLENTRSSCSRRSLKKSKFFLQKKVVSSYKDYKDEGMHTCTHYTAEGLSLQNCKSFIEYTDSYDDAGDLKWNPFHFAANSGDCEIFMYLSGKIKNLVYKVNSKNQTCLHIAALSGHVGVSKVITQDKAFNLEVADLRKWTPIHCSAFNGNYELFQCLLNKGSNLFKITKDGDTCLHIASVCGHLRICELILFHSDLKQRIDELKDVNKWLNYTNRDGNTCLHLAAKGKHAKIIRLLLEYDIDDTVKNEAKETALDISLKGNDQDISKLLKEKQIRFGELFIPINFNVSACFDWIKKPIKHHYLINEYKHVPI